MFGSLLLMILFIVLDSTTYSVFLCKFLEYPGETEFSACKVPKYASVKIAQKEISFTVHNTTQR
jgi:hypothetical protein